MDTKPYVFISYAHKNSDLVFPAIQKMQEQGVELWYDNGIEAGSEWPEFVAEKVLNCTKFVLFISNAYLDSQNCKRELNFAISRKKEILSVFLEDVTLSPGMEMQLGTYQAIFSNRFPSMESCFETLPREPFFNSCKLNGTSAPTAAPQTPPPVQPTPVQTVVTPVQTASTPVQPVSPQMTFTASPHGATMSSTSPMSPEQLPKKNKILAVILAFFLGSFGLHKFYLKQPIWGILYLVFFWTRIPTFLGIVDSIILLCTNKDKFEQKYKCRLS